MSIRRLIPVLLCAVVLGSCATEPAALGPLVYMQQFDGNVSTIVWPVGAARASQSDTYAPDFRWHRADSTLDSLSGHRGQIVLVNFWATWCVYCKTEMPSIQAAANQMGDSLFVIGVSVDYPGNPFTTVQNYVQGKYTYQFAIDSVYTLFWQYFPWVTSPELPVSCFIDHNGKLMNTVIGEIPDEQTVLYWARKTETE